MKKLMILAALAASTVAHAESLTNLYVGEAQTAPNHTVLLPVLFTDEKQCLSVGNEIAKTLMSTESRGMLYTCEPVMINTKTLKDFLKAQK
jgi:hypothetical protein